MANSPSIDISKLPVRSLQTTRMKELFIKGALVSCTSFSILITAAIVILLFFQSRQFFGYDEVSITGFLTGSKWNPKLGQVKNFGIWPLVCGTMWVTVIAMAVAIPMGLTTAIFLSEYAPRKLRAILKPTLEVLAGVPTVVYGFFALLTVGPTIRGFAEGFGFSVPTQSALAAGVVMGVMIIPLISSLSDDVINAVPQTIRDGSYALGATKSETMKQVVFAGALPGIIGAFLLAISRAIGETMIVVMAAGRAANLTGNPFEAVTTVTVQIVALLTGDQEFDSPKTLAAFALGLVLFVITLILNVIALTVVRKYREKYD